MEELLDALQKEDGGTIDKEARKLFITHEGLCNWAQLDEFERYAPCRIDAFGYYETKDDEPFGVIRYNDKIYPFG
jgi:hypothetical protein